MSHKTASFSASAFMNQGYEKELESLRALTQRLAGNRSESVAFLKSAGITTETGRLKKFLAASSETKAASA